MLVLTRKINEKLIINGNVKVVVLEATKNSVRIGIEAPNDVPIYREEIYTEIQNANKQSGICKIEHVNEIKTKEFKANKTKKFDLSSQLKNK